jgi:hypothetical protein
MITAEHASPRSVQPALTITGLQNALLLFFYSSTDKKRKREIIAWPTIDAAFHRLGPNTALCATRVENRLAGKARASWREPDWTLSAATRCARSAPATGAFMRHHGADMFAAVA